MTLDQLKRRDWRMLNKCYLCKGEEETTNHILFHCSITIMLWQLTYALFGVQWVMHSIKEFLLRWHGSFVRKKRKKSLVSSSFILIFYHLEGEIGERLKTLGKKKGSRYQTSLMYNFLELECTQEIAYCPWLILLIGWALTKARVLVFVKPFAMFGLLARCISTSILLCTPVSYLKKVYI